MTIEIQRRTLEKTVSALQAVIDQYADDDYAEGDSYAVRLSREALAAIEADPAWRVAPEGPLSANANCPPTDH